MNDEKVKNVAYTTGGAALGAMVGRSLGACLLGCSGAQLGAIVGGVFGGLVGRDAAQKDPRPSTTSR